MIVWLISWQLLMHVLCHSLMATANNRPAMSQWYTGGSPALGDTHHGPLYRSHDGHCSADHYWSIIIAISTSQMIRCLQDATQSLKPSTFAIGEKNGHKNEMARLGATQVYSKQNRRFSDVFWLVFLTHSLQYSPTSHLQVWKMLDIKHVGHPPTSINQLVKPADVTLAAMPPACSHWELTLQLVGFIPATGLQGFYGSFWFPRVPEPHRTA